MNKEIKFVPECVKDGVFTGHLVLIKPSVNDLFDGSAIAKKSESDELGSTKDLLSWSKKFYKEVAIESVDGSKYQSFDELMEDAECLAVLQEVAVALVTGLNKKKLMTALTPKKGK
jgi:hypothetical protein